MLLLLRSALLFLFETEGCRRQRWWLAVAIMAAAMEAAMEATD